MNIPDSQTLRNPDRVEKMQKCVEQMQNCNDFTAAYPEILARSMHPFGAYYQQECLLEAHLTHAQRIHERAFDDFERLALEATSEL